MSNKEIEKLVNRLENVIDKCEDDFEEMAFNPDLTFDLLLESHSMLSNILKERTKND